MSAQTGPVRGDAPMAGAHGKRAGIVGAGSWGIALAYRLAGNGAIVTVYTRSAEQAARLNETHENKDKLPGVLLPEEVRFTADLGSAVRDQDLVVLAVPSVKMRETAAAVAACFPEDARKKPLRIVDCTKGFEDGSLRRMSQVIEEEIPFARVVVLSGPSHAEEVGRDLPTTIVAASADPADASFVQEVFMHDSFRVYTGEAVIGVETGAALKNVIALAAGTADGLGYGDNTRAALITRGIAEITRLGVAMGGRAETFAGLSGIGDLIVTCTSQHSRNHRAGVMIGQGIKADEAMRRINMVVEGVYSARAAKALADAYHVSMPIVEQVNEVLFHDKSPAQAVHDLMLRDKKDEMVASV